MATPLIALVAYRLDRGRVTKWSSGAYAVPDQYVESVRRAGAEPVLLAPPVAAPVDHLIARFDGLLLIGGGDVDPERYGAAQRHPDIYGVDVHRDRDEVELLRTAAATGVPTLAICRGFQVMNVAFGGTLIQHLPDRNGPIEHRLGDPERLHAVRVEASSRLATAVGRTSVQGASRHHQGLGRLGEDLVAVGWADDGLVEAIEHRDGWLLGVQWHPEVTAATDPGQQALFDALAHQAASRSDAGR
jgi:gamma-glutamyl-gamma-aminobutyrate hydrolase PuuD